MLYFDYYVQIFAGGFTKEIGPVWFMPLAHLTKILVMPNLLSLVWFLANLLAAHGTIAAALRDSSQDFGQPGRASR
jgi:hypothetical protein